MMENKRNYLLLLGGCFAVYLGFGLMHLFFGDLHDDEGFYVNTAKLVWEGKVPYRDFYFSQPPVYPYFLGFFLKLFGANIWMGRAVSMSFGLFTMAFSTMAAHRLAGRYAGFFCALCFAANPYLNYTFTIAKLFSGTSLWLALFALIQTLSLAKTAKHTLAAVCLVLAVGTRLSVAPVLALFLCCCGILEWRNWRLLGTVAGVTTVSLAVVYGPFMAMDFEVFSKEVYFFNLPEHHGASSFWATLPGKAFSTLKLVRDYMFVTAICVALLAAACGDGVKDLFARSKKSPLIAFLASGVGALFAAHFVPATTFHNYHAVAFPWAAILAGCGIASLVDGVKGKEVRRGVVLIIVTVACAAGYPRSLAWFDITSLDDTDLRKISRLADVLRTQASGDGKVWSFELSIPLAAGRDVPDRMAMGVFGFFSRYGGERGERFKVTDMDWHQRHLRNEKPQVIILRDSDFVMSHLVEVASEEKLSRQSVFETAMGDDYELVHETDSFGWHQDTVRVFIRKEVD